MSHIAIVETLKGILKRKKMSYRVLAHEIGMSESGLKKLLTAKDISLGRLTQIAEVLGVSLSDLILLADEEEVRDVKFTERQEAALLADFKLFRILWRIGVEGKSEGEILRLESLSEKKWKAYLLKLENLDLITVTRSKVSVVHKGLYRWSRGGELVEKLNQDWSSSTLDEALKSHREEGFHRLSFLQLSARSKDQFYSRLNDLIDEFARVSRREKTQFPNSQLQPLGSLVAISPKGFLD